MNHRTTLIALLLVVSTLSSLGNADDRDGELFRLRLENAALRARIEAGVAELTKPLEQPAQPAASLTNFATGRLTLPTENLRAVDTPLPPEAQPTPLSEVHRALSLLDLSEKDVLGDIGCGADARVLIEAARVYGCRGIGLEIDADRAESAKQAVEKAGLSHKIAIYNQDAENTIWRFNKAYVYLWPETLSKLSSRLASMDKVVSFSHYVSGLTMVKHGDMYLWERSESPQAYAVANRSSTATPSTAYATATNTTQVAANQPAYVQQRTTSRQKVAYWGGRQYTRPVCTSGNCSMCNSIRSQLNRW